MRARASALVSCGGENASGGGRDEGREGATSTTRLRRELGGAPPVLTSAADGGGWDGGALPSRKKKALFSSRGSFPRASWEKTPPGLRRPVPSGHSTPAPVSNSKAPLRRATDDCS